MAEQQTNQTMDSTKRLLTCEEKTWIVDFIRPSVHIPIECAERIRVNIVNRLMKQLDTQYVYPSIIPDLKKEIERQYHDTCIQAGEMVGVICAQSLGEKQTQGTLNSFHHSGISSKTVTSGVPRFREMLDTAKTPKISNCKVYFKSKPTSLAELRLVTSDRFKHISLNNVVKRVAVRTNMKDETWYAPYKTVYGGDFITTRTCVRFTISKKIVYEYRIKMSRIADLIKNMDEDIEVCVFSPLADRVVDVFVRDGLKTVCTRIKINAEDMMKKIHVCGVPRIEELFFEKEMKDGVDEWFLETLGTNLQSLLNLKIVDYTRTISSNIWEIYEVLGIEAVRAYMIDEFCSIMDGVNKVHVEILVEKMTFTGTLSSISRYTMRKDQTGPLSRASFEECVDNLIKASVCGEVEPMKGVSSAVICGKQSNIGTGMMDLHMNLSRL